MNDTRVAVYIDFDNVVISRYDSVHGKDSWRQDNARQHRRSATSDDPIDVKLALAEIDLGAIIDYAASFGTVALTRAYADWSVPANAAYKAPLIERAIDLVQLFAASGTKNGADIRLAVDAVEDLARHGDITHMALVAGDSDYVPLAQRCKRMGRFVVGIGVAGSTSQALVSACDEFRRYEALPGVTPPPRLEPPKAAAAKKTTTAKKTTAKKSAAKKSAPAEPPEQAKASSLLVRAARVGLQKGDDEWIHASWLKNQMQRMDPEFNEKPLGFSTFRGFVESRSSVVETKMDDKALLVRLR